MDPQELLFHLNEKNGAYDKGWNRRYLTDQSETIRYYLRGEEYSSQIDYFIELIKTNSMENINSFGTALSTDRTIDLLIRDSGTK